MHILHFPSVSDPSDNELEESRQKSQNFNAFAAFQKPGKKKRATFFAKILSTYWSPSRTHMKPYKKYFEKTTKISQTL